MATPIIEYIAANIQTTLDGLATSGGKITAIRPKRIDFQTPWGDRTLLITQIGSVPAEVPYGGKSWVQTFMLTVFVIDSDTETDSIDTRLNTVRADIEKQLMVDDTRGGYAYETTIGESVPFDDDDGTLTGIAMTIEVSYRTELTDPYTQI